MPRSLTISVAMCTYNGSDFILEQLASLVKQKRPPDEIVICDDGSIDDTVEKIRLFEKCSNAKIKLSINENNLGITKNFETAIQICSGDIIALADQDDIWLPNKLRLIEREFIEDESIGSVFSNALIVDGNLTPLNYTMWDVVGIKKKKFKRLQRGHMFNSVLNQFLTTGATMAFRSKFKRYINPIPPSWFHDAWISFIVSSMSQIKPIPVSLILYRQHQSNQIGGKKRTKSSLLKKVLKTNRTNYFREELSRYRTACERLHQIGCVNNQKIEMVKNKIKHLELRQRLPGNRLARFPFVTKELLLLGYHRYSRGPEIALQDLLFRQTEKDYANIILQYLFDNDWKGRSISNIGNTMSRSKDIQLALWAPLGNRPPNVTDANTPIESARLQTLLEDGGIAHILRTKSIMATNRALSLRLHLRRVYKRKSSVDLIHVN